MTLITGLILSTVIAFLVLIGIFYLNLGGIK